ncbi:MAG: magnesium transporter [Clostridiales bacterium]|nr:magnesium transporter [Clostridiales bacterium]
MSALSTFYLSRLIGRKVYFEDGSGEGKLKDFIVDVNSMRPMVVGIVVKAGSRIRKLDFAGTSIIPNGNGYHMSCSKPEDIEPSGENTMQLVKHILDKRIIDIDGRKLVRANDIRLASLSNGLYVVAVETGLEGLLRRVGLAGIAKSILKVFGLSVPGEIVLWDEVETIDFSQAGIKLSQSYSKLSTLHPSDIADILEDLDKKTQVAIFESLDEEQAADVLEELETDAQLQVIEGLSREKAADVLEKMPSDEVADILDELEEDMAEELLLEMEGETPDEVRELMEYPDNSTGSLMSTDFIAFHENTTIDDTLQMLRQMKPEAQSVYYLYIIDDMERLVATVSLRDIVISEPKTKLKEIMNTNIIYANAYDKISILADMISKYSLLAIPVVDNDMVLRGIVVIDDLIYNVLKSKRRG